MKSEVATRIELLAVELAQLAGAEISGALRREIAVKYKGVGAGGIQMDPVSEIDRRVEELIRMRIAEEFPEDGIIGEEIEDPPDPARDVVWAVDPIDGTANFVNGFPMFASSIGVVHQGRPIAGAVWCSTSHLLRPGVYHARVGGELRFDHEPAVPRSVPTNRRHLVGEPDRTAGDFPWDMRQTGSAAIECAFVAAGLLRLARFGRPNIWDVAGGLALAQAARASVMAKADGRWVEFTRFETHGAPLRGWTGELLLGERTAVDTMAGAL